MTSNDQDKTPDVIDNVNADGRSTPVEIKAAWIGAVAAIAAALIALAPMIFGNSPARNVELVLSVSSDHAQYTERRIKSSDLPFRQNGKAEIRAFYLAPTTDIGSVLSIISLGADLENELFPSRSDIVPDENDPTHEQLSLIWSVIEAAGRSYIALNEQAPQPLSALEDDAAMAGIAVLRRIYLDQFDPENQDLWRSFAVEAAQDFSGNDGLDHAARILSNRFLSPVLDLTITNPTDDPFVVTGISLEVDQVAPAYSGLKSGLLGVADRVVFDLTANTEHDQKSLSSPLQIAPNESARIEVQLNSNEMFSYLLKLKLIRGAETTGETEWFVVDFGFQPPDTLVQ